MEESEKVELGILLSDVVIVCGIISFIVLLSEGLWIYSLIGLLAAALGFAGNQFYANERV